MRQAALGWELSQTLLPGAEPHGQAQPSCKPASRQMCDCHVKLLSFEVLRYSALLQRSSTKTPSLTVLGTDIPSPQALLAPEDVRSPAQCLGLSVERAFPVWDPVIASSVFEGYGQALIQASDHQSRLSRNQTACGGLKPSSTIYMLCDLKQVT